MLTIRQTLTGLFLLLGLGLCLSVAFQTWSSVLQYREAQDLTQSNSAREQIARAGMALAGERTEAYLAVLGSAIVEKSAAELREATDAVLDEATETLARVNQDGSEAVLERLIRALGTLRAKVDARRGPSAQEEQPLSAAEILAGYTQLMDELVSLRVALLAQEHPGDAGTANAFQLRRYSTILLESLSLNEALIGGLLVERVPGAERAIWDQIRGNAERAELAFELIANRSDVGDRRVRLKLASLSVAYEESYRPLEQELLSALGTPERVREAIRSDAYRLLWSTRQVTRSGADLQESLFAYSRDRLADQQRHAMRITILWLALLLSGLAVVVRGAWVVRHWVIQPLDRLRESMLALAGGDLKAPLPEHRRADELGAMADALRVFRANAIRRARLQEERHALHERLQDAHRQLQKDLEAASSVQLSLLPEPARLGGVVFKGQLRPSHFISGDTYDVLRQPNGPVHFFLADVAGHGAAAALVSMASRYAVAQTILRRQAGDSLAQTMARLNDDWPDHLPYFTVIMGELRPEVGTGVLIQAGHPPPLLLRACGSVEMLGQGGLPVGVLRDATFDEVAFAFEPGDRLLVYSDGLSETENTLGQPFTEERLVDLLRCNRHLGTDELIDVVTRAVQEWRGSDQMDDDMTLLVLEGTDGADQAWPIAAEWNLAVGDQLRSWRRSHEGDGRGLGVPAPPGFARKRPAHGVRLS